MTPELIGLAVAIGGAYGIGRYVGTHRERQRARRPKNIDRCRCPDNTSRLPL